MSGKRLRTELQRLDSSARLSGRDPWTANADIRRYMRGVYAALPLEDAELSEPLYKEHVPILVSATVAPTLTQLRDVALALTAHATRLPAAVLTRLEWHQVQFTRESVAFSLSMRRTSGPLIHSTIEIAARPDSLCVVKALQRLRRNIGYTNSYVFASPFGSSDLSRIKTVVSQAKGAHQGEEGSSELLRALVTRIRAPGPQQTRDRALITMSFAAALRPFEAMSLTPDQVTSTSEGLLVDLPNRRDATFLPPTGDLTCPLDAWQDWVADVDRSGTQPKFAFLQVQGRRVWSFPLTSRGLNYLVHQRCEQALLTGQYSFTSLRTGWIRGALREGVAEHRVAAHADLTSLQSVGRHEHRENLLRGNVASRLGL